MNNKRHFKIVLNLLLSAADGFVAVALLLGGWNATNVSAVTGYMTIAGGIVLVYLSTGLWFDQKWKQFVRLILYLAAGLVLFVSALVVSNNLHLNKLWPLPLLLPAILVNLFLSWIRLRMNTFESN